MRHFVLQWKHTRQFEFVQGDSWKDAFEGNFHPKAMANVFNYEELYPHFMLPKIPEGVVPLTILFSESGHGLMIRMVRGSVTPELRSALISKKLYKDRSYMEKAVYKAFNELYNSGVSNV